MSARATAVAFAVLAIVLTLAQDAVPARDWYHGWQYTTVLGIALVVIIAQLWRASRTGGPSGKRVAIALGGAAVVAIAGLLSGLIGPDSITVVGTPGTVTPVPDLGAAAFFAQADAQSIPRGDATVTLRRRNAADIAIGTRPVPVGLWVAFTQLRNAAYVVVRDDRGERLTVTQPNNSSFLSPVVLFRQTQEIHGQAFPFDTLAVPSMHLVVRVLYFSAGDLAKFPRDPAVAAPHESGAILSVADDAGKQHGITMALSGRPVKIAGLNVTVTLGSYPVLQLASAPQPYAVIAGLLIFVIAGIWSLRPVRTAVPLQ